MTLMTRIAGYARWKALIDKHARRSGIPAALIAAIIEQESGGQPEVVSRAGAVGLMQVVPRFHPECGDPAQLTNPDHNIACGVRILMQYNRYLCGGDSNDWQSEHSIMLTVAAYNGGPGNVHNRTPEKWPPETRRYARNVMALYYQYQDAPPA